MFATFNVIFTIFKDQQEISIRVERESLTFTAREMLLDNPWNKLMWKKPDGVREEAHVGRGAKVVY